MKVAYTKHALEKFKKLELEGWFITKFKIRQTIRNPLWVGISRDGQEVVISLIDQKHILRLVLDRKNDIIKVITFHIGKRGRYGTTL